MDSSEFHVVEIHLKRKLFNAVHYIEHILQPILELYPESVRRRLVIHADNTKSHMARQSQEFCEQNSLKIVLSALLS
jgi:hypothetical protein